MLSDEIPNEYDVFGGNDSAPVTPLRWHLFESMAEKKLERKSPGVFERDSYRLTRSHTGAASVSGFPAASSNCA